jgi:dipeptidyl aminopeptidase/acylaminoacyl peptidase
LYTCAIGAVGVYDLPLWAQRSDVQESKLGRSYIQDVLGDDEKMLRERSPIAHLDKLKAKVMLIVGGADRRVPPAQGKSLHEALEARKIDHEWVYHVNEGHGYYNVAHRVDMYEKVLAFLDRNIGASSGKLATH